MLRDDAIPVLVAGQAERNVRCRVDGRIDVDRGVGSEERGVQPAVVLFKRIVLKDEQAAEAICTGAAGDRVDRIQAGMLHIGVNHGGQRTDLETAIAGDAADAVDRGVSQTVVHDRQAVASSRRAPLRR